MLKILLTCFFFSFSAPALAVYKCESNGKVIYSDAPCQGGKTTDLSSHLTQPTASETAQAHQIRAQEKNKLQGIESERHKREAKEEKQQIKAAHAFAAAQKKCAALAQRTKWSSEDAANASGKKRESAQRQARRMVEKYELECGK